MLFAFLLFGFVVLTVTAIQYRVEVSNSVNGSINFVSDLFSNGGTKDAKVHSTYGFDVSYDQKKFYGSAIEANKGDVFVGADLAENRPYTVIRISPTIVNSPVAQSAFTLTYHQDSVPKTFGLKDLKAMALSDGMASPSLFNEASSKNVTIGGQEFVQSKWSSNSTNEITAHIKPQIVTYVGIVHGKPITIVINYGLGSANDTLYQPIVSSIHFNPSEQAYLPQSSATIARTSQNRTLLDSVLLNNTASAADSSTDTSSEKVAALYGPATVKIYNVYCMDISVNGHPFVKNVCNGGVMGSGFFVSQDGYIATNGHVATADAKSAAIAFAFATYSKSGNSSYLAYLLNMTSLQPSDIAGKDATAAAAIMIDSLYGISDSVFTKTNNVNNLLVGLSTKSPDLKALLAATNARTEYPAQDTIKRAKLVASDYRALDGIDGFKASDVAIIKVDGTNYPVVKLGDISDVDQGANINILGFPGDATYNGIVDSTVNTVTLTTGKVSSIKNADGNGNKLIETDTTIGHGNSGGPAISNSGEVVGIATYTVDGSGTGNGVFNYIRDIGDLESLAKKSSITFDTNSQTQAEWQKGIDYFYTAHYSMALTNFNKVKSLYPNDSKVGEFIATANKRIANGEDVKDFPIVEVTIAAIVVLAGIGLVILKMIQHKKHHDIYMDQVGRGNVQPFAPGSSRQQVSVPVNPLTPLQQQPFSAAPANNPGAIDAQQPTITNPASATPPQPVHPIAPEYPATPQPAPNVDQTINKEPPTPPAPPS